MKEGEKIKLVLGARVVCEREEVKTDSGLILVPTGSMKLTVGRVIDHGPECVSVTRGDRVLWGQYAFTDIDLNGIKVTLMNEEDILLILEDREV